VPLGRAEPGNVDPNIVRANAGTADVEIAQSRPKQTRPAGKPVQPSPVDERKRLEEEKLRQAREEKRQKLASERRAELERLASIRIAPQPTDKQFMPADWQQRLTPEALKALDENSKRFNVPRELLARVLWQENEFKEKSDGDSTIGKAKGIAQLIDGSNGVKNELLRLARLRQHRQRERELVGYSELNVADAISMAAEYLRLCYERGGRTWPGAVAGYNFGPYGIEEWLRGTSDPASRRKGDWQKLKGYLPYVFQGDPRAFDE
jgi:soluble lytic murein transglycosylase-like protein